MSRRRLLAIAALLGPLAGCAVAPEEDPVMIRLSDLDGRVARVERVLTNDSLLDLSKRIDALQGEVRSLRGSVEQLENQTAGGSKQQRDLYGDLERRLVALEAGASGLTAPGSGSAAVPGDELAYERAFNALKSGNYPGAIDGFKQYLQLYPTGASASNAQYWLGEAYYVTRDYGNAAAAFQRTAEVWPTSRKVPDALVKLGYTQFEQKRFEAARDTLNSVVQRFPGTDAARLATERLQRLPNSAR
ncbi:MAG: tol-pal system protein YbgF [Proteobacteria bacterium]|nr:tol-pal system protein YbgF [Pseudomonadota bacterium]